MKTTYEYVFFWNGIYSQWYPCKITDATGLVFNCAEQYMMYFKAILFGDKITANEIMKTSDPKFQKQLGRKVKGFIKSEWSKVCQEVVWAGNYYKFSQNESLRKTLLETGDKILVEASPYDNIWGIGMDEDNKNLLNTKLWGENLLGKQITSVRKYLQDNKPVRPCINTMEFFKLKGLIK